MVQALGAARLSPPEAGPPVKSLPQKPGRPCEGYPPARPGPSGARVGRREWSSALTRAGSPAPCTAPCRSKQVGPLRIPRQARPAPWGRGGSCGPLGRNSDLSGHEGRPRPNREPGRERNCSPIKRVLNNLASSRHSRRVASALSRFGHVEELFFRFWPLLRVGAFCVSGGAYSGLKVALCEALLVFGFLVRSAVLPAYQGDESVRCSGRAAVSVRTISHLFPGAPTASRSICLWG